MTAKETASLALSNILSCLARRVDDPFSSYSHACQALHLLDGLAGGYRPANEEERLIMEEVAEHIAALQEEVGV